MRQLILVVVLVAASFLGGAFVNGPGLQWVQTSVLRSLGLHNGGEIISVDLKSTASSEASSNGLVLAKPETYMNLSGISVQALVKEFDTRDLIVIYDEIALPLGSLRIRERGSSGGHNGVKSVSGALGSEEWLRIRIGVAPPGDEAAERARRGRKDYVLTPMRKAQLTILDQVLDRTAQAVEMVLAKGAGPAMNEFNRREPGDE